MATKKRVGTKFSLGGGTTKPKSWGKKFPGRGGDTGKGAFFLKITNLNEWLSEMDKFWRDAKEEAEEALGASLKRRILAPSLRLCPIETGALRASAWSEAGYKGGHLQGSVGYDTDYAVYVHEVPAYHRVGQWKFLEQPFSENAYKVAEDVLRAMSEKW